MSMVFEDTKDDLLECYCCSIASLRVLEGGNVVLDEGRMDNLGHR